MKIPRHDDGVFAILYAALIVAIFGMAAIVVDLGQLRADKREGRTAADAAALAGVSELGIGPYTPLTACQTAWAFTLKNLRLPTTADPCADMDADGPFVNPTTPCPSPNTATGAVPGSGVTISITWPVASTSAFLIEPDGKPGPSPRPYQAGFDGSAPGCDRLAVSVRRERSFGLAAALGATRGVSAARSVARLDPDGGNSEEVAALNVLNSKDCESLVTTGTGTVLVGPTLSGAVVEGPGIIAVESDATGVCSGSGYAIAPTTGGALICASSVPLAPAVSGFNCDGKGVVRSHALDPGGNTTRAYDTAATSGGNLKPVPTAEGGRYGWDPVTKRYGCAGLTASVSSGPCVVTGRNHIKALVDAYGSGTPTTLYQATPAPAPTDVAYPAGTAGAGFVAEPALCGNIKTTVILPPNNYHATCGININGGGSLIIQGGTLVVDGGIEVASGGCLVINSTTCTPGLAGVKTAAVTTVPAPTNSAMVYIRGSGCPSSGCFSNAGILVMPETFVYSSAAAEGLDIRGTALTLWSAPGAGPVDAAGHTRLEHDCLLPPVASDAAKVDEDCMNSRFARTTYWSEFPSPKTKPNNFAGQGSLNVVGVFFTPRAYFDFSGGGAYASASAQFWADKLNINGGAKLGLSPDARFSFRTPTSRLALIR